MKKGVMFLMMTLAFVLAASAADNDNGNQQRVGLVLSGGGAKGIAEIGVIQAFEENDIPIDYVTGTSMGAIVGGLYAAGYSPAEMLALIKSKMFLDSSTGTIDPKMLYLFFKPEQRPSMVTLNFGTNPLHKGSLLPSSLISPMPMNFNFMQIFAAHTAQCGGDFDKLFVPLRTVASDMTHKHKVVFSKGQLDNAVRASMSFPIVFKPIKLDGALLYDGGIYDNFPTDVMREDFKPDIMIGVDIHGTDTVKGFPDIIQQMDNLVIRPTNNYEIPPEEGIKLRINLNEFSLLDFPKAQQIYDIGYKHGLEMVDSIKKRVTARRPAAEVARRRAEFHSRMPKVRFDSVTVTGATADENEYIGYLFKPEKTDTFGLVSALNSYTKVISTGQMRDLDPMAEYNPETGKFTLDLQADAKNNFFVGLGGYLTSSVNSMIFVSTGYRSLSFRTVDASVNGWFGQSYIAGELNARAILRRRQSSSIGLQAVMWRQKFHENDKLFYEDDSPAFITDIESFVRLKYSIATGRRSVLDFGVALGHLDYRYYNNDETIVSSKALQNKSVHNLWQATVRWEKTTLNDELLPIWGHSFRVLGQGVIGRYHFHPGMAPIMPMSALNPIDGAKESRDVKWLQLEMSYRNYYRFGHHWAFGWEGDALLSTRKLMKNYNAAIVNAPALNPTPSSYNVFNPELRANSYVALGIVPIYRFNDRLSVRATLDGFLPLRHIEQEANGDACYGKWLHDPKFFGELSASYKLPFGNLSMYGSYQTSPGNHWGIGVSFGYFILAPRMTRL